MESFSGFSQSDRADLFFFTFFGRPPSFPFSALDLAFAPDLILPRWAEMLYPQEGHFIWVFLDRLEKRRVPGDSLCSHLETRLQLEGHDLKSRNQ